MQLPPGKTEQEVMAAIEKAVNILAPSFVFGYMDLDDIKQTARMYGLQCLRQYDSSRPLDNFVYSHIKNRLINYKRDNLRRNDAPCRECHAASMTGSPFSHHTDSLPCQKYRAWKSRNDNKANIMHPLDLDFIADEREPNTRQESEVESEVETKELLRLIDMNLDVDLRATFLQMKAGQSVPKARRMVVEKAVRDILKGAIECPSVDD
ncbi:MAG: hypothetical protein K2R98_19415 [Gemmataceae bacterium]|nr:hypothetical protein [Gemmataceae bacterium]